MAFYVPLGPRGIIFRIGTLLIGGLGSVIYGRAHRRRRRTDSTAGAGSNRATTAT